MSVVGNANVARFHDDALFGGYPDAKLNMKTVIGGTCNALFHNPVHNNGRAVRGHELPLCNAGSCQCSPSPHYS